jgi:hypothetical protein
VDESWNLLSLVVDTGNRLGGQWVLVSPRTIESIDVPNKQFRVVLSRDEIQRSPPIEAAPIELIETLPPFIIIWFKATMAFDRLCRSARLDERGREAGGRRPTV